MGGCWQEEKKKSRATTAWPRSPACCHKSRINSLDLCDVVSPQRRKLSTEAANMDDSSSWAAVGRDRRKRSDRRWPWPLFRFPPWVFLCHEFDKDRLLTSRISISNERNIKSAYITKYFDLLLWEIFSSMHGKWVTLMPSAVLRSQERALLAHLSFKKKRYVLEMQHWDMFNRVIWEIKWRSGTWLLFSKINFLTLSCYISHRGRKNIHIFLVITVTRWMDETV